MDPRRALDTLYGESEALTEPAVVPGGAAAWRPVREWSLDRIIEKLGDHPIRIFGSGADGNWFASTPDRSGSDFVEGPLHSLISRLDQPESDYYAAEIPVLDFPSLAADLDLSGVTSPLAGSRVLATDRMVSRLWIGRRSATNLHYDLFYTLLTVLTGDKVVYLYPPAELSSFYPSDEPEFRTSSRIGNPHRDAAAFPEFPAASERRVDVHPGDLLFIPVYWWHYVRSSADLTVSLTVHFDFAGEEDDKLDSPYFLHAHGL
jgi:cupin-like protein